MSEKRTRLSLVKQKKEKHLKERIEDNKISLVVVLISIIVLIFAYIGSPLSKISDIEVRGVNELGEQQVINASKITTHTSVMDVLFHKNKYENDVKNNLESISKINFKIKSFNKLVINTKEYSVVGYLLKNNKYHKILSTGKIVSKGIQLPIGNFPVYSKFHSKKILDQATKEYSKSNSKVKNSISEIKYSPTKLNNYRVRLFMNDGNEVIADIRTMKEKLSYYPSISNQMAQKGIVDLEIGAYSRPFSQ